MITLMLPVTVYAVGAAPKYLYVGGICIVESGVVTGNALPNGVSYNHAAATLILENADTSYILNGYN